jgi:hypothetical protein
VLKAKGKMCFVISAPEQIQPGFSNIANRQGYQELEEAIIYYGMERGLVFITRTTRNGEPSEPRKVLGRSLNLIVTATPPNQRTSPLSKRPEEIGMWFCKS